MQRKKKPTTRKEKPAAKPAKKPPRKRKPGERPPVHTDPALRAAYLEAYASRDASQRLGRMHRRLHIRQETVDHWLADDEFRAQLKAIDERRLENALQIAATQWPMVMAFHAEIAAGLISEDKPDIKNYPRSKKGTAAWATDMDLWARRNLALLNMAPKSATLVGDALGALKKAAPSVSIAFPGEMFNKPPETPEDLLSEADELLAIEERARRRRDETSGEG